MPKYATLKVINESVNPSIVNSFPSTMPYDSDNSRPVKTKAIPKYTNIIALRIRLFSIVRVDIRTKFMVEIIAATFRHAIDAALANSI